jgi:uncharacterized protein
MSINDIIGTDHEEAGEKLTPDAPPKAVEASEHGDGGHTRTPRPRGFAAMDRRLVTEIARKGGKAAHTAGTAHEFTTDEAREAGRKGGRATHAKRRKAAEGQSSAPSTEEKQEG